MTEDDSLKPKKDKKNRKKKGKIKITVLNSAVSEPSFVLGSW